MTALKPLFPVTNIAIPDMPSAASPYLSRPLRAEAPLTLPPGLTEAEALAQAVGVKRSLWRNLRHEDQRLDQLERFCVRLCGDRESGRRLAQKALWSPTP